MLPRKIKQVFMNILRNAIDALEEEKIKAIQTKTEDFVIFHALIFVLNSSIITGQ